MLVQFKVSSTNHVGESVASVAKVIGAIIEQVPLKPPVAPIKNSSTTKIQVIVDYMHLYGTANGGSDVTSYEI